MVKNKSIRYKKIKKALSKSGNGNVLHINEKIMEDMELQVNAPIEVLYNRDADHIIIKPIRKKVKSDKEMINELIKKSSRKIDDKEMG